MFTGGVTCKGEIKYIIILVEDHESTLQSLLYRPINQYVFKNKNHVFVDKYYFICALHCVNKWKC